MTDVSALVDAAASAGLSLGDPSTVSMTVYAINDEAYGSQNFLVGDAKGYRAVFKRSRDPDAQRRLIERMRVLRSRIEGSQYADLRERIITGIPVPVKDETWLLFSFAAGRSAYVDIRADPRNHRVRKLFEHALAFCRELDAAAHETTTLGELIEQSRAAIVEHGIDAPGFLGTPDGPDITDPPGDLPLRVGIAHLDLVPDNLISTTRGDLWVDWEYWDEAPTVFNTLDAMLSFGSIAGIGPLRRRSADDALRAFEDPRGEPWRSLDDAALRQLRASGPAVADPQTLRALLDCYFAAKATTQARVYGSTYGFSRRWLDQWRQLHRKPGLIEAFARRWPT